jgi:hypothetical protein
VRCRFAWGAVVKNLEGENPVPVLGQKLLEIVDVAARLFLVVARAFDDGVGAEVVHGDFSAGLQLDEQRAEVGRGAGGLGFEGAGGFGIDEEHLIGKTTLDVGFAEGHARASVEIEVAPVLDHPASGSQLCVNRLTCPLLRLGV